MSATHRPERTGIVPSVFPGQVTGQTGQKGRPERTGIATSCPVEPDMQCLSFSFFSFRAADEKTLDWTAGKLKGMGVAHLLGAHCTGVETVFNLRPRPRPPHLPCRRRGSGLRSRSRHPARHDRPLTPLA